MSNLALPAHLQGNDEAAKRALQDAASMSSASNSVPRISLKGREFRLIENGEEVKKIRDRMRVVILGVEPDGRAMVKAWYKNGYKSGSTEPPNCSSEDGIRPSPWAQEKQSPTCANCPKNQFGSATSPSGKATKACRDSKRAWVVEAELQDGTNADGSYKWKPHPDPLEERTQYGLNVTVASLKAFAEHGRVLAGYGQSPCVAVTELEMLDMEFPQLKFNLVGWLSATDVPKSLDINTKRPWKMFNAQSLLTNDGPSTTTTLPLSLPAHLQPGAQQTAAPAGEVTDVQAKPAPSNAQIDDAVGNW
jgi:transposase-like protein